MIPLLKMTDIHVNYGSIRALKGVNFDLYPGEVHALVGEHRAGKSSLVKLLSGAVRKKNGEIFLKGKKINYFTPSLANKHRIGMIYQYHTVIETLSAVENIYTGQGLRGSSGFLDLKGMNINTLKIFDELGLDFDPNTPLLALKVGQRHMVEFARLVMMDPEIIILDEISSKLTPEEMRIVYSLVQRYREQRKGIIYISHDMDEILRLADRVTILKNGYGRGTEYVKNLDKYRLFQLTYSFVLDNEELDKDQSRFLLMKSYIENILHHLTVGAILLDEEGALQIINAAAVNIMGLTEDKNENTYESFLSCLDQEFAKTIQDGIAEHMEISLKEISLDDGPLVNIDCFPFRDASLSFQGTIILINDVSIDHYLSDYIIQSEKMSSVAEVAVGVAHEINNPLFIIQNYIELLKVEVLQDNEDLCKIEKELQRIVEIVGNLLAFSRESKLPEMLVDLTGLLEEILDLLGHTISEKHIIIKTVFPDKQVNVKGKENRLKQLFMNLVMNSIEAVLDGGQIKITVSFHGEFAGIEISDNGYGIPEDIRHRILNPFYSTKVNRKNTGLGLSICMQILKEHQGELDFKSVPGKETVFCAKLPLAETGSIDKQQ